MTDKQIIIDGKTIGCPCYINRPLHRYDKACLVQSQAFTEQQTEEKPILRCDEIKNCPIKENYKQLKRKEQEYEELRQYHNKCCEENVKKLEEWLEKYNQFSKDFFIGKYCKKEYCELLKAKEQECEELKRELQAQRDFTTHEQKLIYCVAYDETCKTGNDCKQEKCIFKDNIKLKQTLTDIKEIAEGAKKDICNNCSWENTDSCVPEDYTCGELIKILQKISECEVEE